MGQTRAQNGVPGSSRGHLWVRVFDELLADPFSARITNSNIKIIIITKQQTKHILFIWFLIVCYTSFLY